METRELIITILGSGAFFAFVQWFITFIDNKFINAQKKKNKEKEREELQISMDRKMTRIQLLLLIADYPTRVDEIMDVAYTYFIKLNGDWFAHGIFDEWLDSQELHKPELLIR